jgi:hypothetical protein
MMKPKRLILVSLTLAFTLSAIGLAANVSNNGRDSRDTEDSIMVDGLKRTYLIHIPPDRDQSKPLPLVIVLHGGVETVPEWWDQPKAVSMCWQTRRGLLQFIRMLLKIIGTTAVAKKR